VPARPPSASSQRSGERCGYRAETTRARSFWGLCALVDRNSSTVDGSGVPLPRSKSKDTERSHFLPETRHTPVWSTLSAPSFGAQKKCSPRVGRGVSLIVESFSATGVAARLRLSLDIILLLAWRVSSGDMRHVGRTISVQLGVKRWPTSCCSKSGATAGDVHVRDRCSTLM